LYKILLKILAAVVLIIFLGLLSLDPILKSFVPEYENKDNCLSKGTLQLICNLQNPEDFAEIPGEDALIISQFAGLAELNEGSIKTGVLSRLDLETKKIQDYEITFIEESGLGIGEEDCKPYKQLFPHGIDTHKKISLKNSNNFSPFLEEAHLLAVINHELIDRVEFFLFFNDDIVFSDSPKRTLFWIGCVAAPRENTYFNDVVIKDDVGGFFATHQYDKDWDFSKLELYNIFKWDTGYVYEWNKNSGFNIVENSQGAWPNGIEIIEETLFISFRMNGTVASIENGKRKNFKFRNYLEGGSDNIIAKGDELWIAVQNTDLGGLTCMRSSQIQCATPFSVITTDKSLNMMREYTFGDTAFGGLSVVYPFKDELILGSYKSDRIGIFNIND
tara:strand:- start:7585 stop:8751 length:1167 start_codon:yes stop_codon:yes gene_type:complete